MRVRLLTSFLLACLFLVVSPASGQEGIGERKQVIDGRIDVLQKKIEAAREREGVLTSQIAVVTSKIRALQDDVDSASARLDQLENVLALHQRKLDRLNQLYRRPDAQARLPPGPAPRPRRSVSTSGSSTSTPPTRPPL